MTSMSSPEKNSHPDSGEDRPWSTFVNAGISFLDYGVNRLLIILGTNVVMARALEPAAYGEFAAGMTVAQTLWVIADMGLGMYATREIAVVGRDDRDRRMALAGELLAVRLLFAALSFSAVAAVFSLPWMPATMSRTAVLCSVFVLVYALYPDWYFRAVGNFRALLMANMVSLVLYLGALVLLISGPGDLTVACLLWAFCYAPAVIILHAMIRRTEGGVRLAGLTALPAAIRRHVRVSVHFLSAGILNNVYISVPIYAVAAYLAAEEVGHFNASYRLYLLASSLLVPLTSVYYPLLSGHFGRDERARALARADEMLGIAVAAIVPAALVLGLYGGEITVLLFGAQYGRGAWILAAFAVPVVLSVIRLMYALPLAAAGYQARLARLALVAMVAAVAMSLAGAAWYGLGGVVLAVILAECVYCGLVAREAGWRLAFGPGRIARVLGWRTVAGAAAIGALFTLPERFWMGGLAGGLVLYAAFHYPIVRTMIAGAREA